MTEGEADDADDAEAEDLLAFASGLDYDAYIDDLEVRQALSVIRERIDAQKAAVIRKQLRQMEARRAHITSLTRRCGAHTAPPSQLAR